MSFHSATRLTKRCSRRLAGAIPSLLMIKMIPETPTHVSRIALYRERVFGSFSHRDLRFGENQVWRFTLSTCSFEVEKEKWGLFIDSACGSGVLGGETLTS